MSSSSSSSSFSSLPWVEKYRPASLDDVISHQEIISTIKQMVATDRLPHLLLYGPAGTGKTSTILACARSIPNCQVLELNASDERGIDVVREQIKDFASTKNIFGNNMFKLIVLDEADHLTQDAQAALRRIIEKYTSNARFCLICNFVNKIIPALQSRCTKFRFGPLVDEVIVGRLASIAEVENLKIDASGLQAVSRIGDGDMRKCVNLLQACALAVPANVLITDDIVYSTAGAPHPRDIDEIVNTCLTLSFREAVDRVAQIKLDRGLALVDIVRRCVQHAVEFEFLNAVRAFVIVQLADIEYRLASGTTETVQTSAFVGVWQAARLATAHENPSLASI
eukprot:ANDGO_05249.mRNA.1 Replication factor C subunit 3